MSKVFIAEYNSTENVFRLEERPEGVADHEKVQLTVERPNPPRSIIEFSGCLSKEAGDSLAKAIEEMFPPWE